jgi:hypothetical protein
MVSLCSSQLIAAAGCAETCVHLYNTAHHRIKDGHYLKKKVGIFVFEND